MRRLILASALAALSALATPPALAQDDDAPMAQIEAALPTMEEATTIQPGDHLIGADDAAHDMVIYASVTCGHCGAWFTNEWPRVKSELIDTGRLRVAFRELPTPPAQISMAGFLIANCAPEEKFFESIVGQMESQDEMRSMFSEGLGQDYFVKTGEAVGIEGDEAVKACFADEANFAPIDLSMQRFEVTESRGVPAFFADGDRVAGDHDADAFIDRFGGQPDE